MSARFLAWYTAVALGLGVLLLSAVTVAHGYDWVFLLVGLGKGTLAVVFAIIGTVLGHLPQEHWANRSPTVRAVLLVVALIATLFMVG